MTHLKIRDVVSSQFHWVSLRISVTNIGQTDFTSSPFNMWPISVESGAPRVPANGFHTGLCGDYSMEAATTAHVPIWGIGRPLRGEYSHSRMKRRLSPVMIEILCGFPKLLLQSCHHLIHHLTCMLSFVLTNSRYQTLVNWIAHICHCQRHSTYS